MIVQMTEWSFATVFDWIDSFEYTATKRESLNGVTTQRVTKYCTYVKAEEFILLYLYKSIYLKLNQYVLSMLSISHSREDRQSAEREKLNVKLLDVQVSNCL